jgi:hypothetical protein
MAISEMPIGESKGPMEAIAVDQGAWRLKGIRMCTSHHLDRMGSNSASSQFDRNKQFSIFSI